MLNIIDKSCVERIPDLNLVSTPKITISMADDSPIVCDSIAQGVHIQFMNASKARKTSISNTNVSEGSSFETCKNARFTDKRDFAARPRQDSEILASRFIAIAESMSAPNKARRFSALDLTGQVAQLCVHRNRAKHLQ